MPAEVRTVPDRSALPPVVVATRNAGKLREVADLLGRFCITVRSLADFDDVPEIVESGTTFAENAQIKAREVARHLHCWAIGEDSGLSVDALDGAPGVYSARYSGPAATDESNNAKLLEALRDVPEEKRTARYICHVAVADPAGNIRLEEEACCRGRITTAPRGTNGFGYDPLFLIPEYHRTFGELSPLVKRWLSHRGRAFQRLAPRLVACLRESAESA